MAISEKKMQIVIDNYFKSECNLDTSIRDAFEKGFRIGVQKTAHRPEGEWIGLDRCSVCGKQAIDFIDGYVDGVEYLPNYCPNCGAKMKGGAK